MSDIRVNHFIGRKVKYLDTIFTIKGFTYLNPDDYKTIDTVSLVAEDNQGLSVPIFVFDKMILQPKTIKSV